MGVELVTDCHGVIDMLCVHQLFWQCVAHAIARSATIINSTSGAPAVRDLNLTKISTGSIKYSIVLNACDQLTEDVINAPVNN